MFGEKLLDAIPRRIDDLPALLLVIWKIAVDETAYGVLVGTKVVELEVNGHSAMVVSYHFIDRVTSR
jgi:hypothetical protein